MRFSHKDLRRMFSLYPVEGFLKDSFIDTTVICDTQDDILLFVEHDVETTAQWWASDTGIVSLFMKAKCVFPPAGDDFLKVSCPICIDFGKSIDSVDPAAHMRWRPPLHICRQQRRTLFSTPSVTELLLSHPVLFLINQPGQHPHISVALRKGIYHSAADQIWHGPSRSGNSPGGYTYTVDLLAWYNGQSRIKYVPRDTSHSSWSCHELIFTTRTSRNWKTGETPSQVDRVSKAGRSRSSCSRDMLTGTQLQIWPFFSDSTFNPKSCISCKWCYMNRTALNLFGTYGRLCLIMTSL